MAEPSGFHLVLRMPETAHGWRVQILVYDDDDNLLCTDEGNLMSLAVRKKVAKRMAEELALNEDLVGRFATALDGVWKDFFTEYQRRLSAGPAPETAGRSPHDKA